MTQVPSQAQPQTPSQTQPQPTTQTTQQTFTTLISARQLAANLHNPDWVVLDCRHELAIPDAGQQAYAQGHIPDAQFAHLDHDLSDLEPAADGSFRGRHPLPSKVALQARLRSWGINNDTQVVAYDAQGGSFAARLWWMLRWLGHTQVAVLDGGLQAWQAAGLELSNTASVARSSGTISAGDALESTVDVTQVLANLRPAAGASARMLLDARAPDRFRGENETLDPVGGHIPGAKNRFFKDNLEADGRFKPAPQLRREFNALLSDPASAIMQCGSGVSACHNLLALEIAGLPGAALYPGSWSEWCADPARPVARGA